MMEASLAMPLAEQLPPALGCSPSLEHVVS